MRWIAILGAAMALSGCAGGADRSAAGDPCQDAGHRAGTEAYAACRMKLEDDQARATRKVANDMPIRGYGPMGSIGRF